MFPIIDLEGQIQIINERIVADKLNQSQVLDWLRQYGYMWIDEARTKWYQAWYGINLYGFRSLWGIISRFYFDESNQIHFDEMVWRGSETKILNNREIS